ncbi:uncharacterized protein LOC142580148 isoform X2 [Dermacentor variabilis]|uniref:uncharacterized protein LOC142580148 isoform X2 n=1 Tax=Dermacentor variabilis TaxID=34621 RepID=UPI003F5C381C
MSRVLHCDFKSVDGLDQHFRPSILRKGRRLFENNHVYGVREVDETDVSAKCLSQQSKHMYEVGLKLTMQPRKIESGVCTCRYGSMGNCKHCAAVAFYLNEFNHASCTSAPQTWGKPAGKPLLNDKASIGELFGDYNSPFVGNRKPAELSPFYALEYFPGIVSPFTETLAEMAKSEADLDSIEAEKKAKQLLQLQKITQLLPAPCKALHELQVFGMYPKQIVKPTDHIEGMTQQQKAFYNANIACGSLADLCVATMGQSSCVRYETVTADIVAHL